MSEPDLHDGSYQLWHDFLLALKPKTVLVTFADQLAGSYRSNRVRARRDFPKLLEMIKVSAYLHQHHRDQDDDVIIASKEDHYLIKPLFEHCYRFGPDFHTATLLDGASGFFDEFTVADLQRELGWGKTKTYDVLFRCSEMGFVVDGASRGHYRVVRSAKLCDLNLPGALEMSFSAFPLFRSPTPFLRQKLLQSGRRYFSTAFA